MAVAAVLFVMMAINYGLNAASIRMVAKGRYLGVAILDALIALLGFWMIQEVAHTQTWLACVGFVSGGVTGSMVGMWFTRRA